MGKSALPALPVHRTLAFLCSSVGLRWLRAWRVERWPFLVLGLEGQAARGGWCGIGTAIDCLGFVAVYWQAQRLELVSVLKGFLLLIELGRVPASTFQSVSTLAEG